MKRLPVLDSRELGEVNAFLDGLKDPAYKKRMTELEAMKTEVNDLILVYGKVKEIESLSIKQRQLTEGAGKLVEDALVSAKEIREAFAVAEKQSKESITQRESEANARWGEREHSLVDGERDLEAGEKALAKGNDALIARDLSLASEMTKAKEMRLKYTEAVASLTNAIEQTRKAL